MKAPQWMGREVPEPYIVKKYLSGQINPVWVYESNDSLPDAMESWKQSYRGTIMPCSPGAAWYKFTGHVTEDVIEWKVDYELNDITKYVITELRDEPERLTHRSRLHTLAFGPYRQREQMTKLERISEYYSELKDIALSERESSDLFHLLLDQLERHTRFNGPHIDQYVNDHRDASIGGGYSWSDLKSLSRKHWLDIFDQIRASYELLRQHEGYDLQIPWRYGLRARSQGLELLDFEGTNSGELDRCRIIQFHPAMQLQNMFLPSKKPMYSQLYDEVINYFSMDLEMHTPLVEGAGTYVFAGETLNDDSSFHAYDGKNWEMNVGTILGRSFRGLMMNVYGYRMMPTGTFITSGGNTMAMIASLRFYTQRLIATMLGDDATFYRGTNIVESPWMEYQPADNVLRYMLGFSFREPLNPTIVGIKVMSDNSKRAIPVGVNSVDRIVYDDVSSKSLQEISTWNGMFFGFVGDGSLFDALRGSNIGKRDYIAPGELIEDIAEETSSGAFAWAEREGVKDIITRQKRYTLEDLQHLTVAV